MDVVALFIKPDEILFHEKDQSASIAERDQSIFMGQSSFFGPRWHQREEVCDASELVAQVVYNEAGNTY
jgi:hypothetical protein